MKMNHLNEKPFSLMTEGSNCGLSPPMVIKGYQQLPGTLNSKSYDWKKNSVGRHEIGLLQIHYSKWKTDLSQKGQILLL
jgi:hypothetical protein